MATAEWIALKKRVTDRALDILTDVVSDIAREHHVSSEIRRLGAQDRAIAEGDDPSALTKVVFKGRISDCNAAVDKLESQRSDITLKLLMA